jgi:hypothetical protein
MYAWDCLLERHPAADSERIFCATVPFGPPASQYSFQMTNPAVSARRSTSPGATGTVLRAAAGGAFAYLNLRVIDVGQHLKSRMSNHSPQPGHFMK